MTVLQSGLYTAKLNSIICLLRMWATVIKRTSSEGVYTFKKGLDMKTMKSDFQYKTELNAFCHRNSNTMPRKKAEGLLRLQ